MGDKAAVASIGNSAISTSTTSGVIRRRSAVVDRLRQRIELFRDRSSTSLLQPSSSAARQHDDLVHHRRHNQQQHPYLGDSRQRELTYRCQEQTDVERHLPTTATTTMMTDGGCWTAVAAPPPPPDSATMVDPGTVSRWTSRGNGPRMTSATVPGVDARQWQSTEVSSSVTSSRVGSSCFYVCTGNDALRGKTVALTLTVDCWLDRVSACIRLNTPR
jgi:hypothetical protein